MYPGENCRSRRLNYSKNTVNIVINTRKCRASQLDETSANPLETQRIVGKNQVHKVTTGP